MNLFNFLKNSFNESFKNFATDEYFSTSDFLENIERKQVVLSQKAVKQREAKV